ncbi:MAG: hypothetical protein O3A87_11290, partial [Verrucomicrobia bacterium]|nr:hypothetical protein [Verrucomicrobiota bacterium]
LGGEGGQGSEDETVGLCGGDQGIHRCGKDRLLRTGDGAMRMQRRLGAGCDGKWLEEIGPCW